MITARYADAGNTKVQIYKYGRTMTVPADANNALYRKLGADGIPIAAFVDTAPVVSTDPVDWPLNRFQFEGMLLAMGVTFAEIETAIAAMDATDMEKAFAVSRLRNAVTYQRGHPLIASLMPVFDLTDAEVEAAWMAAKDIH